MELVKKRFDQVKVGEVYRIKPEKTFVFGNVISIKKTGKNCYFIKFDCNHTEAGWGDRFLDQVIN